ncbi:regulator with homeodomain-like DNA binding domain [Escherichia coli]|uniref:Regulator with homeodomain-like DNA binding domain n=1 Tax=Escherichia coli TaxID=562 RepID=A0A376K337_ECOLX|nr:regulator with homeodomain-like DNA binding domain [Escherichia coli]
MLHTANPVIKHKAGLLNLAEELSNVSKACKIMGVSRETFYRYRELAAEGGVDVQINRSRRAPNLKNRTDEATETGCCLITPSLSRHMVSTGPATSCVNRGFLSPTVVSVLSGYSITLRISKDDTEQILSGGRSVKKLYGVLDAVGATISTPAEPWTIGPPYWGMSPWRAAGFPLMVYFLFLSRREFILIRKDYLFSDRDSH